MPDDSLIHRAVAVNFANLALGHETFAVEGATFVRQPALPNIYVANFVYDITASTQSDIGRLLARVEEEYAHAPQRVFRTGPGTPPQFEARLALDGYARSDALVLVLEGSLRGEPKPCDIRLVDSEDAWVAYTNLTRANWSERAPRTEAGEVDLSIGDRLAAANRLKSSQIRFWLAYAEGEPRGMFSSWEGPDGVGQVEDLFVLPEWRYRGLATALIHHCVADARSHGAGPIVIVCDPADTPKHMYAAMGWKPTAVAGQYLRSTVRETPGHS